MMTRTLRKFRSFQKTRRIILRRRRRRTSWPRWTTEIRHISEGC
jgi:hypothetical protein